MRQNAKKMIDGDDKCPQGLLLHLVSGGLYRELRDMLHIYGLDPGVDLTSEQRESVNSFQSMVVYIRPLFY